jgi:hypothetical protein
MEEVIKPADDRDVEATVGVIESPVAPEVPVISKTVWLCEASKGVEIAIALLELLLVELFPE